MRRTAIKRTLQLTTALVFVGNLVAAQSATDAIVADLTSQGYTRIEVKVGPTQTKVEATRGTEKFEGIYDAATGELLKGETEQVGMEDHHSSGSSSSDDIDDEDDDDDEDEDEDDEDDDDDDSDDDSDDDEDDDEDEDDDSDDDSDDHDDDSDDDSDDD